MKKLLFILLIASATSLSKAQSDTSHKQATQMLKQFYIAYNTVWATNKNYKILTRKLDSLQKKYCTVGLQKQLRSLFKEAGLDHDALINDESTDVAHLNTLKIISDPKKENAYIVSYVDHTLSPANKAIDNTVIIHVTVATENGSFKISDVSGDAISLK